MSQKTTPSFRELTQFLVTTLRHVSVLIGPQSSIKFTLEAVGSVQPGLNMEADCETIARLAAQLEKGVFQIITLGEFNNGKSTLVNSLLGEKLLPIDIIPTTGVITVLAYGRNPQVKVYYTGEERPRVMSHQEFAEKFRLTEEDFETIGKKGYLPRFENIEYALIEIDHPFCRYGVRIVDTPGLQEHLAREKATLKFLKRCQAYIFVLNGTHLLNKSERDYLQTFGTGPLDQLFVVVNFANRLDQAERQKVETRLRTSLKPFFAHPNEPEQLDEALYERRVFWVDAKSALQARVNQGQAAFQSSGVAKLYQELDVFLSNNENRMRAVFASTAETLAYYITRALRQIHKDKNAHQKSLAELKEAQKRAETSLAQLRSQQKRIISIIEKDTPQKIMQQIEVSLSEYITGPFRERLEEDKAQLLDHESVKKYISEKVKQWALGLPSEVSPLLSEMQQDLLEEINLFQITLEDIQAEFAGVDTAEIIGDLGLDELVSELAEDISILASTISSEPDWGNIVVSALTSGLATGLLFGPVAGIILGALLGLATALGSAGDQQKIGLTQLVDDLPNTLRSAVEKYRGRFEPKLRKRFEQFATGLIRKLGNEIAAAREWQQDIIDRKGSEEFSLAREAERLTQLTTMLVALFNQVGETVYGKTFTAEDIEVLAQNKEILEV